MTWRKNFFLFFIVNEHAHIEKKNETTSMLMMMMPSADHVVECILSLIYIYCAKYIILLRYFFLFDA